MIETEGWMIASPELDPPVPVVVLRDDAVVQSMDKSPPLLRGTVTEGTATKLSDSTLMLVCVALL